MFQIDPSIVSQQELKTAIKAYVQTLPDASKWRDFYESSTGDTIINLLTSLFSMLKYDIIVARRENYLPYATLDSSIRAGAQEKGYSSFRGTNSMHRVTFIPTNTVILSEGDLFATVKGRELIVMGEDIALTAGEETTISCTLTVVEEEVVTASADIPAIFRFRQSGVSEYVKIFVDNVEVPVGDRILNILEGKLPAITNIYGSVDVYYLPDMGITVLPNSEIKLQYHELIDLDFELSDIKTDYGSLVSYEVTSLMKEPESGESVQVNAPLYHETQNIIRGREDYMKDFLISNSDFVDVGYTDYSTAIVELTYLMNDYSVDTNVESYLQAVRPRTAMGVPPPLITHPVPQELRLNVIIDATSNPPTDLPTQVTDAINVELMNKLGYTFSVNELESIIEKNVSGVKIARITPLLSTWDSEEEFPTGAIFEKSIDGMAKTYELYYKRVFRTGQSISAPNLPNKIVEDGDMIWETRYVDRHYDAIPLWESRKQYRLGDVVKLPWLDNIMLVLIRYNTKSESEVAPVKASGIYEGIEFEANSVGTMGNTIHIVFNGTLTAQEALLNWNAANPNNQASITAGDIDAVLTTGEITLSGGLDGINGEPSWPLSNSNTASVIDNDIIWQRVEYFGSPSPWEPETIYNLGDTVVPREDAEAGYMYQCINYTFRTGTTFGVVQDPYIDGNAKVLPFYIQEGFDFTFTYPFSCYITPVINNLEVRL